VALLRVGRVTKADFFINISPGMHDQVDIEDAPEEWGLPDDTYDVKILKRTPALVIFEIVGGEQDGERFTILRKDVQRQ
jgi:hypothetical protein